MNEDEKSTYRRTEPNGIDRLFLSLATIYGKRWFDMWAGVDEDAMRATWVRGLQGLEAYQIRGALDYCADGNQTFPPDLSSFKRICDGMKKQEVVQAIGRKFTKEEMEKNHQRMQTELSKLRSESKSIVGSKDWAHRILANPSAYPETSIKFAREALGE